jgi:hypothetical protein
VTLEHFKEWKVYKRVKEKESMEDEKTTTGCLSHRAEADFKRKKWRRRKVGEERGGYRSSLLVVGPVSCVILPVESGEIFH